MAASNASAAGGLGKAPCLQRVDLGQWQASLTQPSLEAVMVRAGRLKDDADNVLIAKPAEQRLDTLGVIGKLAGATRRVEMHVECRFRDVDTDILGYDLSHLSQVLCLSCGPRARVSVQAIGKEKGDQSLTRPITAGDFAIRPFAPPASSWLAGGSLFFAERPIRS
jgi:hypothetical protein